MSIERIERKDGSVVWRVRWRQAGQNRSKVLGRKRDAEAFDAELRRKRRTGELAALDAARRRSPSSARSGGSSTGSPTWPRAH
jgi:ribosomal protein L15E